MNDFKKKEQIKHKFDNQTLTFSGDVSLDVNDWVSLCKMIAKKPSRNQKFIERYFDKFVTPYYEFYCIPGFDDFNSIPFKDRIFFKSHLRQIVATEHHGMLTWDAPSVSGWAAFTRDPKTLLRSELHHHIIGFWKDKSDIPAGIEVIRITAISPK